MTRPTVTYRFTPVDRCNMCGSDRSRLLGLRLNTSQGLRPRSAQGIAVSVKQCRSCRLIYSDPRPEPIDLADHYGIPAEDYWGEAAATWQPSYFAAEIREAKRLLPFEEGMKALDIGVGLGKATRSLREAGFETWGIEPSEPFLNKAVELRHVSRHKVQLATVEDAEFSPGSFDFITFGAVLEHLYDPSLALAKALAWLKPGGLIHVEVPSVDHLVARLINLYFRLSGTTYVTHVSPMHSPFHMYEFDLKSFAANGERLGYGIAHHDYMVCEILHGPKLLHPILRKWMELRNSGMQLVVYLRKP